MIAGEEKWGVVPVICDADDGFFALVADEFDLVFGF